ncbi:hypothetical protein BRC73_01430 [Halobacteriales archaeon QH_7_66_37]|nr:MAG: hypothetical protein BRC73_01430 [Halobacteriales archaeon QH_7_66_37]
MCRPRRRGEPAVAQHLRHRRVEVLPALHAEVRPRDRGRRRDRADHHRPERLPEDDAELRCQLGGQVELCRDLLDDGPPDVEDRADAEHREPEEDDRKPGECIPDSRPDCRVVRVDAGQQPLAELQPDVGGGHDGRERDEPGQREHRLLQQRLQVSEVDGRQREEPAQRPLLAKHRPDRQ